MLEQWDVHVQNKESNLGFLGHLHYFLPVYIFTYEVPNNIWTNRYRSGNPWLYVSRSILHWSVNFLLSYLGFKSLTMVFSSDWDQGLKSIVMGLLCSELALTLRDNLSLWVSGPPELKGSGLERGV